jgi:hypothetical protein
MRSVPMSFCLKQIDLPFVDFVNLFAVGQECNGTLYIEGMVEKYPLVI